MRRSYTSDFLLRCPLFATSAAGLNPGRRVASLGVSRMPASVLRSPLFSVLGCKGCCLGCHRDYAAPFAALQGRRSSVTSSPILSPWVPMTSSLNPFSRPLKGPSPPPSVHPRHLASFSPSLRSVKSCLILSLAFTSPDPLFRLLSFLSYFFRIFYRLSMPLPHTCLPPHALCPNTSFAASSSSSFSSNPRPPRPAPLPPLPPSLHASPPNLSPSPRTQTTPSTPTPETPSHNL